MACVHVCALCVHAVFACEESVGDTSLKAVGVVGGSHSAQPVAGPDELILGVGVVVVFVECVFDKL